MRDQIYGSRNLVLSAQPCAPDYLDSSACRVIFQLISVAISFTGNMQVTGILDSLSTSLLTFSPSHTALASFSFPPGNEVASSSGSTQKSGEGPRVSCKNFLYVLSAVFVWSRGITFIHYQLWNSWHVKVVDSFQDHLKMRMRLAYFHEPLISES